jgi:hypothetical protein
MGPVESEPKRDVMGSARQEGNVIRLGLTIFPDELARLKAVCGQRGITLAAYIASAAIDRLRKDEEAP